MTCAVWSLSALLALALLPADGAASADVVPAALTTTLDMKYLAVQQQVRRFGPFATIRRAWEVANEFRARGCSTTQPFHSGDGYYVDVQC